MRVIGITGPANSGKDSLKDIILALNPSWQTYSFASPLKRATQEIFGWTAEQIEDRAFKETIDPYWGVSPRQAMQWLGTEYGRDMIGEDIWIKSATKVLERNPDTIFVIPDVRFENEAEWVREHGVLFHLVRPGAATTGFTHESESGILYHPDFDEIIVNDRDLEHLWQVWLMHQETLNKQ